VVAVALDTQLKSLEELDLLSNHLRPSGLAVEALASLPRLRLLDLRFNRKLRQVQKSPLVLKRPSLLKKDVYFKKA